MKKNRILIIGNGGIGLKDVKAYGNIDTCHFIMDIKKGNYNVLYYDRLGSFDSNRFLYSSDLNKNQINFSVFYNKKPKFYLSLLKLAIFIFTYPNIYIYYPGGFSKISAKICKYFKKKYGVYVRGNGKYIFDKDNPQKEPIELGDIFILKEATFLITVSPGMQKLLSPFNKNINIIKPMLNWTLDDIYKRDNKKFTDKKEWKLLFVGSLIELKGIVELIQIAKILNTKKLNFVLRIIGDGVLMGDLIKKQQIGEIPNNIVLLGTVIDQEILKNEYESADAFIFTSRNEGFPRVLYEAMLKSLPIFTTFVGGIPGVMINNFNCIRIPSWDAEKQAEIIFKNLQNAKLLKRISRNGLDTIEKILTERSPHHEVLLNFLNKN